MVRLTLSVLIVGSSLAVLACPVIGQSPAIQIGYVPADTPGPVEIQLNVWAGDCGSDAVCSLFDAGSGFVTADGADAVAVMAAIDAEILNTVCLGNTVFDPPMVVAGATPGEVRHEYRVPRHPSGWGYHLVMASIRFDRGAMSLSVGSPCGETLPSEFTGPYYVEIRGVPAAAGDLVVWCNDKEPVQVGVDPSAGTQAIADSVLAEALSLGIHATAFGTSVIGFNVPRFDQDVSGLAYVGMEDASSIVLEIGNRMDVWVQVHASTWGSVKAIYR